MTEPDLKKHYLEIKRRLFGPISVPVVRPLPKQAVRQCGLAPNIYIAPEPVAPEDSFFLKGTQHLSPRRRALLLPVLRKHGFSWAELMNGSRKHKYLKARSEIYLLLREDGLSYPQIAAVCGGKDHTTVLHAVHKALKEAQAS